MWCLIFRCKRYVYMHFVNHAIAFILVCNQPPRSTQPGHPFVGRHNEYQPPYDWGVKAGMVRVWVAGKTA